MYYTRTTSATIPRRARTGCAGQFSAACCLAHLDAAPAGSPLVDNYLHIKCNVRNGTNWSPLKNHTEMLSIPFTITITTQVMQCYTDCCHFNHLCWIGCPGLLQYRKSFFQHSISSLNNHPSTGVPKIIVCFQKVLWCFALKRSQTPGCQSICSIS